jgi:HAD superfamily hydrolase (TIGR01509 family)
MHLKAGTEALALDGVQAFIFDLDGTLVESEHVWAKAKAEAAFRHGRPATDSALAPFVGRSVADFVGEHLGLDADPQRADAIAGIIEQALQSLEAGLREIPGAVQLVRAAHAAGFRVAICSSAPMAAIETSIRVLGIAGLVETAVSAAGMAKGKPDKQPYVETLQRLGLKPDQAVAFEDSPSGLRSATGAGIRTIYLGPSEGPCLAPDVPAARGSLAQFQIR